jgi:hypothetical protein
MQPRSHGGDWTESEVKIAVTTYYQMLTKELAGLSFIKARFNEAVQEATGRTRPSIEMKFQNISAVLQQLGLPWIHGYKPLPNFQRLLLESIDSQMTNGGLQLLAGFHEESPERLTDTGLQMVTRPQSIVREPGNAHLKHLVRKFDPALRDARNRSLGKKGEELVLNFERQRLSNERPDLARRIRWVSNEIGDGAGYDIHSFDLDGRDRLIEVKTTIGYERTPFFISANELEFSNERPAEFRLIRVYDFAKTPKAYELAPPLSDCLALAAQNFRATLC